MAKRYSNTISASAMSLGIDPDFLYDILDELRRESEKYKETKGDSVRASIEVTMHERTASNDHPNLKELATLMYNAANAAKIGDEHYEPFNAFYERFLKSSTN